MKQCPNPNCVLYTRLEELPDAYTKCPGCGGPLVDATMPSSALHSGYLSRPPGGLVDRDMEQEFQEAFPEEEDPFGYAAAATSAPPVPPPQSQAYDDEFYPYEDTEQDESASMPSLGLSRGARMVYILALGLLLFSCVFFFVVVGGRFLSPSSVSSADATETAIVALRPAVNTPIPVLPTVDQSQLAPVQPAPPTQPVATVAPAPTLVLQVESPTQAPIVPTSVVPQQPQQPQQPVAATAPPAQNEPTGGVSDAQMVVSLDAGQPAGNVSAYHSTDAFVLAVQAQFGAGGVTTMKTDWYGPDGLLLYEIPRDFSEQGTYYTGFTLKKNSPWATGDYRVDIHTNNSPGPAYSVSFSVVP